MTMHLLKFIILYRAHVHKFKFDFSHNSETTVVLPIFQMAWALARMHRGEGSLTRIKLLLWGEKFSASWTVCTVFQQSVFMVTITCVRPLGVASFD